MHDNTLVWKPHIGEQHFSSPLLKLHLSANMQQMTEVWR